MVSNIPEDEIELGHLGPKLVTWLLLRSAVLPGGFLLVAGAAAFYLGMMLTQLEAIGRIFSIAGAICFYVGLTTLPTALFLAAPVLIIAYCRDRHDIYLQGRLARRRVRCWHIVATFMSCAGLIILLFGINIIFREPKLLSSPFGISATLVFILPFGFIYSAWSMDLFWSALERHSLAMTNAASPRSTH